MNHIVLLIFSFLSIFTFGLKEVNGKGCFKAEDDLIEDKHSHISAALFQLWKSIRGVKGDIALCEIYDQNELTYGSFLQSIK